MFMFMCPRVRVVRAGVSVIGNPVQTVHALVRLTAEPRRRRPRAEARGGGMAQAPRRWTAAALPRSNAADKRATKATAFDALANGLAGLVVLLAFLSACMHAFLRGIRGMF